MVCDGGQSEAGVEEQKEGAPRSAIRARYQSWPLRGHSSTVEVDSDDIIK